MLNKMLYNYSISLLPYDISVSFKGTYIIIIIYLYNIYFKYYFNLFSISLKYVGNSESNSIYSLVEGCINPSFLACNV